MQQTVSVQAGREYTSLWSSMQTIILANHPDAISWRWTANGEFSTASAYAIQFEGSQRSNFKEIIWKSGSPLKCRIYSWMAVLGRVLTADNLAKRGWPHSPSCRLCGNAPEDATHLLAACPFARDLWLRMVQRCNLNLAVAPQAGTTSLLEWWEEGRRRIPPGHRRAWSALVQLIWWNTWKERNARIFNNVTSSVPQVQQRIIEELLLWTLAKRTKIAQLMNRPREPD